MSFAGQATGPVQAAENHASLIRIYWLPFVLALLPFVLLIELSQLQEYVRVLIFDFNANIASVCATAVALLALICGLYRACIFASAAGGRSAIAHAVISYSPVAALAAGTGLAAREISGTLFQR